MEHQHTSYTYTKLTGVAQILFREKHLLSVCAVQYLPRKIDEIESNYPFDKLMHLISPIGATCQ